MKLNFNWNKIFLNIYPEDIVKQFKKVVLPFYFLMSFILTFILLNSHEIFHTKSATLSAFFAFYFVFPVLLPICFLGLIFSTINVLRNNNPLFLYHVNFKHFIIYVFNVGILLPSVFLFLIFLTIVLRILHFA
jgi:hypothetical protein